MASAAPFLASSLVSAVVGFAAIAAFTRLLTPAEFGSYQALLALVALLQSGGFLWLQNGVLRGYSKCRDEEARFDLASAAKLGFALVCLPVCGLWLLMITIGWGGVPGALWLVGLPLLLVGGWNTVARSWLRVTNRPWRSFAADTIQAAGGLALSVLALVWLGGDAVLVIGGAIAGGLLAVVVSADLLRSPFTSRAAARAVLLGLWRYGAPLTLIGFLGSAIALSDRLLIAGLVGTSSAGAYSVGYALADRSISLLLLPITLAMKPVIFAAFEAGQPHRTQALIRQSGGWLMAIGLPLVTMLVCAPGPPVRLFAGGGLAAEAEAVVPWVAIGSLLGALLNLHFGLAFQLASRTGAMVAVLAPAAGLNLIANLLLLPAFGAIAAAWTTVGTYAFALCLCVRLGRRHYPVPFPVRDAGYSLAACLPLAALLFWAAPGSLTTFLLACAGGGLLYVAVLALFYRFVRRRSHGDQVPHAGAELLR